MTTPLTALYDNWTRPSYERRVRGKQKTPTYLWGSEGITKNLSSNTPLVLHIRNETFGEEITLETKAGGTSTSYGTLQPAECISIPLQNLSGVSAFPGTVKAPGTESVVVCVITT